MDQLSYEILLALRTSGGKLPVSWLNALTEEQRFALDLLKKNELVIYTDGEMDGLGGMCNYQSIAITDAGRYALTSEERCRKDLANQKANEAAEKRANDQKAIVDKKQSFRHDFYVAAFSVALTLFIEHINDVIDFIQSFFKNLLSH